MEDIKVGDIITQNDNFYSFWSAPKFSRVITNIYKNGGNIVIQFDKPIKIINNTDKNIQNINNINICYLKIDIKKQRKKKLQKLYDRV